MKSFWSKFFGWTQFGVVVGLKVLGILHGLPVDATTLGIVGASLSTAVGIHHAAGTDGSK